LLPDRDVVNLSEVLKDAVNICSDDPTGEIPISVMMETRSQGKHKADHAMQVEGKVLAKVIEWCEHHQRTNDDQPGWDMEFIQMRSPELCDIMNAASYLEIDGLFKLCAKAFAERITGKSARQLHVNLNLSENLAPDEIDDITQENDGVI
jgi:hypothetical protein